MSTHDQFVIDENTTVIVEFPPEEGGFTEVSLSPAEIAQKSAEALSKAMDTIHHMARRVSAMVEQLPDPPTQIEAEFGIKFSSETGAVIAKAGIECNINVKLIWERDRQQLKPTKKQ